MSDDPPPGRRDDPALTRLDPDAVRRAPPEDEVASRPEPVPLEPGRLRESPETAAYTRRYRQLIGVIGLGIVVVVSVLLFLSHGIGTIGVPPGKRLRFFAAPLAGSSLVGDPNLEPPCTLARHDPRALNVCLLVARGPLVLSFFVPGHNQCERQVDALQALSRRFPSSAVQFAAVAVHTGRAQAAQLLRTHHWTIPVAYDRDGSLGDAYGVVICPMAELAYRGGIVADRLIGDHWQSAAALYPRVRALVRASGT